MPHERVIVQKYGGKSLSTPERIRAIAERIAARADDKTGVIVTVSAMGETTDELLRLAYEVTADPPQREMDMLLTVGERITMALLSMALNARGCPAISFTGSQSGIVTTISHTRALIEEIHGHRIEEALAAGRVVIVAGFQGVSRTKEITTLGRGGSDTTAVALAVRLRAECCEIYSDYPGVYTADPRRVPAARAIPRLGYDEMLELAALGARVLHFRAAEIARRYRVPLELLSSFDETGGTRVDGETMEKPTATSITCNPEILSIRVTCDSEEAASDVASVIARFEASVVSYRRYASAVHLVVDARDTGLVGALVKSLDEGPRHAEVRDDLGAVSVVGCGFAGKAEALATIERACAEAGIHVEQVSTSPLSVTCFIARERCDDAVRLLHRRLIEDVAGAG